MHNSTKRKHKSDNYLQIPWLPFTFILLIFGNVGIQSHDHLLTDSNQSAIFSFYQITANQTDPAANLWDTVIIKHMQIIWMPLKARHFPHLMKSKCADL